MRPRNAVNAPEFDDEWLRVPWTGEPDPFAPPEDPYPVVEAAVPTIEARLVDDAFPDTAPIPIGPFRGADPRGRVHGPRLGAVGSVDEPEQDAGENARSAVERSGDDAADAAPVLSDDELDRLFAAPQRPRWKLGLGAVVILALVVCAIVVLAIALQPRANGIPSLDELDEGEAAPSATVAGTPAEPTASAQATLLVHVAGEVHAPGVYELAPGDRVIDAIEAAGGVTDAADAEQLNFARPLVDGEQIYVPKPGEAPPVDASGSGGGASGGDGSSGGLVNLNTASATELETLPRIGPAMSQRIIDFREQNGGFTSVEQLKDVAGIGDATFEGLKDLVTI